MDEKHDRKYDARFIRNQETFQNNLKKQNQRVPVYIPGEWKKSQTIFRCTKEVLDRRLLDPTKKLCSKPDKYEQFQRWPILQGRRPYSRFHETATNYILKNICSWTFNHGNVKSTSKTRSCLCRRKKSFKDKIEDEDKVIKTNSFQTFMKNLSLINPFLPKVPSKNEVVIMSLWQFLRWERRSWLR